MATLVQDPGWEGDDRPHVLIEATEWGHRHALAQLLDRHGYATASCPGPEGADERCPLAARRECRATNEADVVIHTLRPTDQRNREVLLALQQQQPPVRVTAEVPEPAVKTRPGDYENCVVLPKPVMWEAIVHALQRLV